MSFRPLDSESRRALQDAVEIFQAALPGSPAAGYLEGRGITRASAERFRLGYVTEPIPGYERFVGRLAIPNICGGEHPHPVGIKFRSLIEDDPVKYDQPHGQAARMFNARAVTEAGGFICISEGELDTVILDQLGLPAIGIPGSDAWKPHFWRVLEPFPRIVLFRDNDKAGINLEKKIRSTDLPLVTFVPPGVGEKGDVNDSFLLGHGEEIVRLARGTHMNGGPA